MGEKKKKTLISDEKRKHLLLKPKSGCTEWVWVNVTLSCLKEILGQ